MLKSRLLVALGLALLCLAWTTPLYADSHEVDMPYTSCDNLSGDGLARNSWCILGQRLVIPDRYVTAIGYHIWKIGNPIGSVTFSVYNATTDEVIISEVWGDAGNLTSWGSGGYQVISLDEPIRINGEVKLCVEYYEGDRDNYCTGGYYSGDLITGEFYTNYRYGQWHDIGEAEEGSYHYTWIDEEDLKSDSAMPVWLLCPVGLAIGAVCIYVSRKQHKRQIKDAT
jgi:hypothetical protein